MFIPKSFRNANIAQLHKFIETFSFATVISHPRTAAPLSAVSPRIQVSHLPLSLLPAKGKYGTLTGHMARANKHWKGFDSCSSVLCIFHGPHGYISPSWYEHLPEVPTWNYAVVHASGVPRIVSDNEALQVQMDKMVAKYEPQLHDESNRAYVSTKLKKSLLPHIIGFEIEIYELVGKFKLGQNRSEVDQRGLVEGLLSQDNEDSKRLGEFIRDYQKANGFEP